MATVFSLICVSWCEFTHHTLTTGREVSFGLWRYQDFVLIQNVDTGDVWKVDTCAGYPDDVSIDAYWKSARAFSIIAPILGVLTAGLGCFKPELGKLLGAVFILVTTCQGLVFLFFKSDVCDGTDNPVVDAVISPFIEEECELGPNGIMGIVATCLWFLVAIIFCACTIDSEGGLDTSEPDVADSKVADNDEQGASEEE